MGPPTMVGTPGRQPWVGEAHFEEKLCRSWDVSGKARLRELTFPACSSWMVAFLPSLLGLPTSWVLGRLEQLFLTEGLPRGHCPSQCGPSNGTFKRNPNSKVNKAVGY